jgi:hypothetical protein
LKKEVELIIKGQGKKCYSEPSERRSETEDFECQGQTIYHHSNVDKPCAAADTKVRSTILNGRQSQVVESTNLSIDGKICLNSETNLNVPVEEG